MESSTTSCRKIFTEKVPGSGGQKNVRKEKRSMS